MLSFLKPSYAMVQRGNNVIIVLINTIKNRTLKDLQVSVENLVENRPLKDLTGPISSYYFCKELSPYSLLLTHYFSR